jgi:putative methyltransferase (TIGR04325 family)
MSSGQEFRIWEGIFSSFAEAGTCGPGFEGDIWRERSVQVARECLKCLERGEPIDYSMSQRNALLPVVAAMILSRQERMRILDFGGGPGYGFIVLLSALGKLRARVEYHVVDVACVCEEGKTLFSGEDAPVFHTDLSSTTEMQFDLVHTSSTMQYIEDWKSMVGRLARYKAPYVVMEDVFVGAFQNYVTVQNYYGSRIPHWFLNDGQFVSEVERHGYALLLRTPCHVKVLGRHGPLPMTNFPEEYRLYNKSNLVFGIDSWTAA